MKKKKRTALKVFASVILLLAALVAALYLYVSSRANYVADDQVEFQAEEMLTEGAHEAATEQAQSESEGVRERVTQQVGETENECVQENVTEQSTEPDPRKLYDISLVHQPTEEEIHGCYTLLVVCADSKEEEAENDGRRSDAEGIILMTINHEAGEMFFLTLHSDLYVQIPGVGGGRLGHSYAMGGGPLLAETIRQNYGIETGNYARISLRDVARELKMEQFETMDISRDGLDVVEKLIYSLNYDNPLEVAAALNNILRYVSHNMTLEDIARLTLQIPIVLPYYSEKVRVPQDGGYGEYRMVDGYLVPVDIGDMSLKLQEKIYAKGPEE